MKSFYLQLIRISKTITFADTAQARAIMVYLIHPVFQQNHFYHILLVVIQLKD